MKRFLTLFVSIFALIISAQAQSEKTDSLTVAPPPSYQLKQLHTSSEQLEKVVATGVAEGLTSNKDKLNERFKMYPTENMWNFLKLDTCTGRVWQVQFVINGENRMQNQFIYTMLDWGENWDEMDNVGRFELYPTQNMYNFLLLDKKLGRVWQIQWSTNPDNRGLIAEIE